MRLTILVLSSAFLAVGCGKGGGGSSATPVPAESQTVFLQRCVSCHGAAGAGDGVASASLNPKPRNFQDKSWQKSVTDEHIEKIIVSGGAAVGKSPAMPGNPDLQAKADVVRGLRAKIRSLGE
jgi:mono/diheme cytochrome c family protein